MVSRSPEEKEADDRLTLAIEHWLRVNKDDGSACHDGVPRVLTDYIVFTATQGWKPDGDMVTGHPFIVRDGSMPMYRLVGLARMGMRLVEDQVFNDDKDDDE